MKPKLPVFDGWLAHGWGVKVNTSHQLFRIISHIGLLAQERTYAWRGQNDAAWDLSASLFRQIRNDVGEVTEERVRSREVRYLRRLAAGVVAATLVLRPPTCTCWRSCSTTVSLPA